MIAMAYQDTCTIMRRQDTDKYGGVAADEYDVYKQDEPCHFIEKIGRLERKTDDGRDIVYSGVLMTDEQLYESDTIVMDDVKYKILEVQPIRDVVTRVIRYYRAMIERAGAVDLDAINDEPIINL